MIPKGAFLTAALVFGGIAAATGSIPGSDEVINGCYTKASGVLRVIDTEAEQRCKASEAALSWNQVGLKGETGATGPAGPAGEQGPAGEPGASGAQELFFASRGETYISIDGGRELISKSLPAGSYRIEAQVMVRVNDSTPNGLAARCWLTWDGDQLGAAMDYWEPNPSGENKTATEQIELIAAATKPEGNIGVKCRAFATNAVAAANLVATRVASVG